MVGNHGSSSQMGSQQHNHGNSSMPISLSSAMNANQLSDKATGIPMMSSASFYKLPSQGDCFYNTSSGWDAIGSLSQSGHLGTLSSTVTCGDFVASGSSYPMELDGREINSNASHHLTHYSSNPNLVQMLPKLPVLSSRGFSEMVNPFAMVGCAQNTGPLLLPNPIYASENIINPSNKECQSSRETAMGMSPNNSKRKRDSGPASPINLSKNSEGGPQRDASGETSDSKGSSNDKRQKMDPNPGVDQSTKKTGKQSKSNSQGGGEPAKEDYVHIRARRGQATNSHSLAERVRREKISERMRLLQELVPGCNKITGKAVMLDEIINYVQSLQQQVEFLSMKLAAVNPELNFDIEQLLTKDVLHSRGGSSQVHGYNPGISSPHPFTLGLHPSLPCLPNTAPPYHSMPQALWDGELQNLVPMDFDANPAAEIPKTQL